MTPGSIILHENFTFHDGAKGKKYLIILGSNDGVTLMVKTTSQGARYLLDFGCQINHRFPNFSTRYPNNNFIPRHYNDCVQSCHSEFFHVHMEELS